MQIWCTSLETGECRKITAVPGGVTSPLWSPDGRMMSFLSSPVKPPAPTYIDELYPAGTVKPVVIEDFGYKFDGAGFIQPGHTQLHLSLIHI